MRKTKAFIFFGWLAIVVNFSGCQPQNKPETQPSTPKVEKVAPVRSPKLVMTTPRAMDLTATQGTPASTLAKAAIDETAQFYIHAQESSIAPTERSGAKFDHVITLNGKTLTLRGVTARKFEMSSISLLTVYTVGFYIEEGVDVSGDILPVEKALILEYHMDVPKEKVVQAIKDNVAENPKVNRENVFHYFEQLSEAFDSPKKGDRYEFPYIPGSGTAMIKAGKLMTVVQTEDFEQAFFGIWLSPHGKDKEMRCELLALPCPEKSILNPANAISSGLGGAKEKLGKLKNLMS